MNTACTPCCTTPLSAPVATRHATPSWQTAARTWWTRWKASRQARRTSGDLTALDGLNAHSLKDIGAPEWVIERTQRAQERARQGGLFEQHSSHWR